MSCYSLKNVPDLSYSLGTYYILHYYTTMFNNWNTFRTLLLIQYQVAEDGRVSRVMHVKISSVAGEVTQNGLHNVVWAGAGEY
jgi:hypothetical protein